MSSARRSTRVRRAYDRASRSCTARRWWSAGWQGCRPKLATRSNSSDESLIARTPLIYSRTRNVGTLSVEHAAPGTARLRLSGWPTVTDRQLLSIATSIETVLTLTGREHSHARTRRVDGDVLFELRWSRRR